MPERTGRIRVVLVDDEPLARATLRKLLAADPEVELVAECAHGEEAVEAVRAHRPDLVFLDVQMPGMDGFEVIEDLASEPLPLVVFVTAYDRYALRAFEVHAVDYLLKPFDDERFAQALERAKERLRRDAVIDLGRRLADLVSEVGDRLPETHGEGGLRKPLQRLAIHREGRVDVVEVEEVVWIEAADQYVKLHTEDDVHLMRESMTRLEQSLDPDRFLRVHRSAIVALERVRSLESAGGTGRIRVGADTWLPVSRSRLAELRRRLG